jgi:tRNA dimethylallyltransferase
LTGPTASGKASIAAHLAETDDLELISVDSMKVYRGLDIGTAKPALEMRRRVRFHLVDVAEADDVFSLARFLDAARGALAEIRGRGRKALFVGGTPLYLRGLLYGIFEGPAANWEMRRMLQVRAQDEGPAALHAELQRHDPRTAERLHPNDVRRIIRALEVLAATGEPMSAHQQQYPAPAPATRYRLAALRREPGDLRARIAQRTERLFAQGLVEEVRRLKARGALNRTTGKAIGYREVLDHLEGKLSLDEAVERVNRNTWRLARKQSTWLRSFPEVRWLAVAPEEAPSHTAGRVRETLFGNAVNRD